MHAIGAVKRCFTASCIASAVLPRFLLATEAGKQSRNGRARLPSLLRNPTRRKTLLRVRNGLRRALSALLTNAEGAMEPLRAHLPGKVTKSG